MKTTILIRKGVFGRIVPLEKSNHSVGLMYTFLERAIRNPTINRLIIRENNLIWKNDKQTVSRFYWQGTILFFDVSLEQALETILQHDNLANVYVQRISTSLPCSVYSIRSVDGSYTLVNQEDDHLVSIILQKLIHALRGRDWHDEPAERQVYIDALKEEITRKPASITLLLPFLDDKDWAIRDEIIELLGVIGGPTATSALIRVLTEQKSLQAAFALQTIGSSEALTAVQEWHRTEEKELRSLGIFPELTSEDWKKLYNSDIEG